MPPIIFNPLMVHACEMTVWEAWKGAALLLDHSIVGAGIDPGPGHPAEFDIRGNISWSRFSLGPALYLFSDHEWTGRKT